MKQKHLFEFFSGFTKVLRTELTFDEARPKGFELAAQMGEPVKLWCWNEPLRKWNYIGLYNTDGKTMIDSFGNTCEFDLNKNEFHVIKSIK